MGSDCDLWSGAAWPGSAGRFLFYSIKSYQKRLLFEAAFQRVVVRGPERGSRITAQGAGEAGVEVQDVDGHELLEQNRADQGVQYSAVRLLQEVQLHNRANV